MIELFSFSSLIICCYRSCGYYHTAFIDDNGALYVCGNNTGHQLGQMKSSTDNDPMSISLPDKVQTVSCGNQHTVVLLQNGQVYACGKLQINEIYFNCMIMNVFRRW